MLFVCLAVTYILLYCLLFFIFALNVKNYIHKPLSIVITYQLSHTGEAAVRLSNTQQTTNSLDARILSGSPNCAWYWLLSCTCFGQGIPPTLTINVAHLT